MLVILSMGLIDLNLFLVQTKLRWHFLLKYSWFEIIFDIRYNVGKNEGQPSEMR